MPGPVLTHPHAPPPDPQAYTITYFAQRGRRQRVFCASLADVFDNAVDPQRRNDLWRLILATPDLDWLLLTKRIGNVEAMLYDAGEPLPNVWLGATICNQAEADRDIPKLLAVPAARRFLSMEPLLGPVHIDPRLIAPIEGTSQHGQRFIDWIIVGGESGPGARPMHPDWSRSLRDQCEAAGVPFLFKQWGEWWPISQMKGADYKALYVSKRKAGPSEDQAVLDDVFGRRCRVAEKAVHIDGSAHEIVAANAWPQGAMLIFHAGKSKAGRLLDGREWNEVPS